MVRNEGLKKDKKTKGTPLNQETPQISKSNERPNHLRNAIKSEKLQKKMKSEGKKLQGTRPKKYPKRKPVQTFSSYCQSAVSSRKRRGKRQMNKWMPQHKKTNKLKKQRLKENTRDWKLFLIIIIIRQQGMPQQQSLLLLLLPCFCKVFSSFLVSMPRMTHHSMPAISSLIT